MPFSRACLFLENIVEENIMLFSAVDFVKNTAIRKKKYFLANLPIKIYILLEWWAHRPPRPRASVTMHPFMILSNPFRTVLFMVSNLLPLLSVVILALYSSGEARWKANGE